jgi:hypothetical protein
LGREDGFRREAEPSDPEYLGSAKVESRKRRKGRRQDSCLWGADCLVAGDVYPGAGSGKNLW